jgi:aldose 1-epimerase
MLSLAIGSDAANYAARKTTLESFDAVTLEDAGRDMQATIVPAFGNNLCVFKVKGHNIMWNPLPTVAEAKARPMQIGNPLLAPWANRIDQDAYWINGRKYLLNPEIKNFRRDPNGKPMHGLLQFTSDWKVTRMEAGPREAVLTCRLEFWRRPDWMAQFPFAHNVEMTHRLKDGALEVETVIENLSVEAFPISLSFHTYYQLFDAPRDEWRVHVAARKLMATDAGLIPTGELQPAGLPDVVRLKEAQFDSAYTELVRDAAGRATFWVQGKSQKISVSFGPKFPIAVVFAPDDAARRFICFEPMASPTNAFNLHHAGRYPDLQTVAPGASWRESFWIRPEGFER